MPPGSRSVRQEQRLLSTELRSEHKTWGEIAKVLSERYRVNVLTAIRLTHGWSQRDVARLWNEKWPDDLKTFKNFSYWELWPGLTGHAPSLDVLARLAELYECSVSELVSDHPDFRPRDQIFQSRKDAESEGRDENSSISDGSICRLAVSPDSPNLNSRTAADLDSSPLGALGTMNLGPGMSDIRAMSDAFQAADRRVGGERLYIPVMRYIANTISPVLLDPPTGPTVSGLFSAAASLTEIAGWMSHDGGNDERARTHFEQAYRLAVAAENDSLAANICASISHLALQLREYRDSVRIADAGLVRAQESAGSGRLAARLYAMRARGLASQEDERECMKSLELAEQVLQEYENEQSAEWIAYFDRGSLASEAALCLRRIGRLKQAEEEANRVIELRSGDRVRSRAFGQLTLAQILIDVHRIDEAVAVAGAVREITPSLNSARVASQLEIIRARLRPHQALPAVSDFLQELSSSQNNDTSIGGTARRWPL